jgi:hypothetical protein
MTKRILWILTLALCATAAFAAQPGTIEHTPVDCVLGGEMAILNVQTSDQGVLRAYFRRTGATDWCSVDGKNLGDQSQVTLPKFDLNEQIEYYFVVIEGKKVIAKSPKIYNTRSVAHCESPFARHSVILTLECLPPGTNPVGNSMAAAYALTGTPKNTPPPVQSPEKPEREKKKN